MFGAKRLTTSGFSRQARLANKFAGGLAPDPQRIMDKKTIQKAI
jgi:hypothetical protein